MKQIIANSVGNVLIVGLLSWAVSSVAQNEEFQMINKYEEVEKHENYSRVDWFVASERNSVDCGGVYKRLQSEVISPGYPDNYGDELHCEYTFKSPFVCSSQYHFQFLDFDLEPSRNCYKDRLVIGDQEDLCGTVIGSKKYNSTNGILKVKFVTDGWGGGKGFRVVVTRQPCEDNEAVESSTSYTVYTTIHVAEDTTEPGTSLEDELLPPEKSFKVSSRQDIPPEFNPGGNGYLPPSTCPPPCVLYPNCGSNYPRPVTPSYPSYPTYPVGPNYPSYPTSPGTFPPINPNYPGGYFPTFPSYPGTVTPINPGYPGSVAPINPSYPGTITPINPNPICPNYPAACPPNYPNYPNINGGGTNSIGGAPPGFQPTIKDPEIELTDNRTSDQPQRQDIPPPPYLPPTLPGLPQCCRNVFNQKRFYLVSPSFPSYQTINRDCFYQINRFSLNTCRLVISFKYFLLGDERLNCADAFLEIDGRRMCGCRTGMVYTTQWNNIPKTIRVRSTNNRYPHVHGFVLDIYQESCPYRYVRSQPVAQDRSYNYQVEAMTPVNITTVQTNSSSLYTYYYYDMEQPQPAETKLAAHVIHRYPEGPSSRFYYPSNTHSYGSCQFSSLDWLRLKLESLWVSKPRCY